MLTIKTILHPTDFSPFAKSALHLACGLARDYGASLIVVYVRPSVTVAYGEFGALPPEPREPVETLKKRMAETMPADFKGPVEFQVLDGDAAMEIVNLAQKSQTDLIVIGTHGRTGLGRLLMGSVAEQVLRNAACPVVTVRQPMPEPAKPPYAPPPVIGHSDELVTIYSVSNPVEAEIIRNALNSDGIQCFFEGAQQGTLSGSLAFPIKIQVAAGDADRAGPIIKHRRAPQPKP